MSDWKNPSQPYSIARGGASAYAPDCSLEAYAKALLLQADIWEIGCRVAACGTLVAFKGETLPDGTVISNLAVEDIIKQSKAQGAAILPLDKVFELALEAGAGIYITIDDISHTLPIVQILQDRNFEKTVLCSADSKILQILSEADSPYLRSLVLDTSLDPIKNSYDCEILHLSQDHVGRLLNLYGQSFFQKIASQGQKIVIEQQEEASFIGALREMPVFGISTRQPEAVSPFCCEPNWPVKIVCHRGANELAPENTIEAANCAFAGGFDYVELDVQESRDNQLVVIHDSTLDRTTNKRGAVSWQTKQDLDNASAGGWYSAHFSSSVIPSFEDILALAKNYNCGLYVELKSADPARTLAAVENAKMLENCFFWAFDFDKMLEIRKLSSDARLMVRRQDISTLDQVVPGLCPQIIEYTFEDDISEFDKVRKLGMKTMLAYMGSMPKFFDQIIAARPDYINLDKPYRFYQYMVQQNIQINGS